MSTGSKSGPGRIHSVNEHVARVVDDVGNAVDPILGERPVAGVEAISDSREDRGVVASPEFWSEDDMAELGAVGDLVVVSWISLSREKPELTPPPSSRSKRFVSKLAIRRL